jgi:hypothetical protein
MRLLLDLLLAFLLLGLVEALVKPIAKRLVQRKILRVAPLVLSQLDPYMPALLQQCSGAQLEQIVRTKLEVLTGESWAGEDLTLLFRLYDPRIACDRTAPALCAGAAAAANGAAVVAAGDQSPA